LALQLVDFDAALDDAYAAMAAAAVNDCSGRGDPAFHELQALLPLQFLLIASVKKMHLSLRTSPGSLG
jgi:hypothetical protein